MGDDNKKDIKPEKVEGELNIAGEKVKIGDIEPEETGTDSVTELEKALRRAAKKKIYPVEEADERQ